MNRTITIDHPYDRITLEFRPSILRKDPAPLTTTQWDALNRAERRIHVGSPGGHGWTDVMCNDGDENLNWLWSQTEMYVREDYTVTEMRERGTKEETINNWILHRTASRVGQMLAIMAFGADILLVS